MLARSDLVFAALPHGLSQETAAACDAAGKAFIDLGADFRLDDPDTYKTWYGCDALYPALHQKAVYGLPELFRMKSENPDHRQPRLLSDQRRSRTGPGPAGWVRRDRRDRDRFQIRHHRRRARPLPDHPFPRLQRGLLGL